MSHRPSLPILLLPVLIAGAAALAQQVEEADLPLESSTDAETWTALETQMAEAEDLFRSRDQAQSIDLFTAMIEDLEPLLDSGTEEEVLRAEDLIARCLSYRAQAGFNFGDVHRAQLDLDRLIRLQPYYEMDRAEAPSKLLQIFDGMKDQMVGYLEVITDPPDGSVTINGEPFDSSGGAVAVVSDYYGIRAERPGYDPKLEELEVVGGETHTVEIALARTSAVLVVRTWPRGATISIDGQVAGTTDDEPGDGFVPTGDAAFKPRDEFGELVIGGLDLGEHEIEVRKPGYRILPGRVSLDELKDHPLLPLLLELEAGTVVLEGLPAGAVVTANGVQVEPQRGSGSPPRLELPPDDYRISVSRGSLGVWEARVSVADRQSQTLQVSLRPGLVLLGVLGGDTASGGNLKKTLAEELDRLGHWSVLDRTGEGPELLEPLGVEAEQLRALAATSRVLGGGIDWEAIQRRSQAAIAGSVYVLAVLNDDLVASHADLWIWPAAPGPSRPDRRRVSVDDREAQARLAAAFSPSLTARRPTLGALVVDSEAAPAPVVAQVTPDGPAAAAGLAVGDMITAFEGSPIFTSAQLQAQLAASAPGAAAQLEIKSGDATRTVRLSPRAGYPLVDLGNTSLIYAALAAELAAELERPEERIPRWILQLNQGAVLLQSGSYPDAVRQLREIEAPGGAGVGQATVQYLLGIALARSGPRYADNARAAFRDAAGAADGKLSHDDGPWIAPRARARLSSLGGGR